ncbi:MAG: insulinase family protein [Spirochaetales bacterium]|nr:insulinase family protein [Spirochaetales bacterium]
MNKINLKEGTVYAGFRVVAVKPVEEYRSIGIELKHLGSGAEVYHLFNDDKENLFSFCFKTPPADSRGAPHIVEHSVLAGSKRFPLKEPFVALLNSSMNTYLNAMTFPDKTVYPASSINEKDFYNLMLVYGDAVFNPLMRKETFMQEAYHLENNNGSINIVGVVFNEMKGAYSNPDSIAGEFAYRSLFPDNEYKYDSGGEPSAIPDLSYEEFVEFHKKYYHPSNCKIFLYGNISTERHLDFLEKNFLSEFTMQKNNITIKNQKRWSKPINLEKTYPVKETAGGAAKDGRGFKNKTTVLLNWLTVSATDPYKVLIMEVLEEILIGNAGSPLRKALVESRLGEDLSPVSGLESEIKELVFSVGLRGTDPDKAEEIEELIFKILNEISNIGIDKTIINAAMHSVEFNNREIRGGGFPYALRLMRKALRGWLHGREPDSTLIFNPYIEKLKKKVNEDNHFFEKIISELLLENTHRSRLVVRPDKRDLISEDINKKVRKIEKKLSESDLARLEEKNRILREYLTKPDAPEAIGKLPVLKLKDVPSKVQIIPCDTADLKDRVKYYFHNIYTNGIVYVDIAVDVSDLPEEIAIYLPVFGRAVCRSGIEGISYSDMAKMLALKTGGFYAIEEASSILGRRDNEDSSAIRESNRYIFFRVKTLKEDLKETLKLVGDLLTGADFKDIKRLKDIVIELRNDIKSALIPNGHYFAMLRAGSMQTKANRNEEILKGVTQLLFLTEMAQDINSSIEALSNNLCTLRDFIINKKRLSLNVTSDIKEFNYIKEEIVKFVSGIGEENGEKSIDAFGNPSVNIDGLLPKDRTEAVAISSKVGYVAKVLPAAYYETKLSVYESVLAHVLKTGYLWEKIRMEGGAYGAFAVHSGVEGTFAFGSYRDPNINSTLKGYLKSLEYYKKEQASSESIKRAIIGTVGRDEKPIDPGERGLVSLKRKLYGIDDKLRQYRREVIIGIKPADISAAASALLARYNEGTEVVMASRDLINSESGEYKKLKENIIEIS